MKKIAIIMSFLSLLIYAYPVMAYDKNGYGDDPVYDWGAGSDDIIIWGDEPPDYDDIIATALFFLWEAPEYIELPDWWYEYYDDYYYHYDGSGPGNGNNSTGSILPAGRNSLPANAKAMLELKLLEMLTEYCAYHAMLSYTSNDGAEFYDVSFNSNLAGGGYNPCTDELFFKDINSIKEAFPEEFIHFFQDVYYHNNYHSGGICIYLGTNAQNNIEFEAKLMLDILNYFGMEHGYNMGFTYYGDGQNLASTYWAWISHLTNNGTSMPTPSQMYQTFQGYNYWDFMNDWALRFGIQIDSNFSPQIFNIFNECQ